MLLQVDLLLGKAYSDGGRVSDAVAVYDRLISAYPNDFRGYLAKVCYCSTNYLFNVLFTDGFSF